MTEERSVGGIEQDKWTRQTEEKTGILIWDGPFFTRLSGPSSRGLYES